MPVLTSEMRSSLLFSWLFMCTISFGVNMLMVSGHCLVHQKYLLLQLKGELKFCDDSSLKIGTWNESADCCMWQGVSCEEGRVTELDLSGEGIYGVIDNSTSLFNLRYLKSLDLSDNSWCNTNRLGSIPSRIGNLKSLRFLNLSNAGFSGQIPIGISRLTSLVTLDFSTTLESNRQTDLLELENPNLAILVHNLTELAELHLDGIALLTTPLRFLANFSSLISLSLSSCVLRGTFPKNIFQVRTLQTIDISNNRFLEGSLPEFPRTNALQRLVLSATKFSGRLPTSIGNLRNLSTLDLSICQFHGPLPNSMANLTQLSYIDLSYNNFTGPIPPFNLSKDLENIALSYNALTGSIASIHWEDKLRLVDIDFQHNFLNGNFPPALFTLPSLKKIQLSNNQLNGNLLEFPNTSSSSLDILDLSSNNLEGPIPISIFELKKLSILSLSSNKLNGTVQLDMIQGLDNLVTLDLSYNNLFVNTSGNHSLVSAFPNIGTVALASCKMKVFPQLKDLPAIAYLDLSDNQIFGELPNWIWQVGGGVLYHLNISHNFLVGLQEPYHVSWLSVLDLHHNQLRGKVPILPTSASYVDLSSNDFNSYIPADIGYYLCFTLFFSLSNNSLTGAIPDSICKASYLQVLDLSDNNLYGGLPECMPAMSKALGVLNLRRNDLAGPIPDLFPFNCSLRTLALNDNQIQGPIPKSLTNCPALELLDLGQNKMMDTFPCFLNLFSLQVLVLRSNKLHGPIGCNNSYGAWAKLQIFDLAHNNFSGELPREFLIKWQAMIGEEGKARSKFDKLLFEFSVFSPLPYYQDTVTVTSKGREMELVKILTIFTCIDLSSNNFSGSIPGEVGLFQALYVLNLSNNGFTGRLPSSLANLREIESLDLSRNKLSGTIPTSLEQLTFLSSLNLSFNQLVGRIPRGNQFETYTADSFIGNEGLYGPPLTNNYIDEGAGVLLPDESIEPHSDSGSEINWSLISVEIGFFVGFGFVIGPLVFCKRWRKWYFERLDDIYYELLIWKIRLQRRLVRETRN